MKKQLIAPFGFLILTAAFAMQLHGQAFLTNGLVAYYPFNGNANDASGNGNNGTVNGATLATDRFGFVNSAYHFGGTGDYISVLDSPTLDMTNALTLSLWINPQPGGVAQPRLLSKHVFDLGLTDTSANPQVFLNIQDYPSGGASIATGPIPTGQWIFLTGTYDRQALNLYINGVLAAQASSTVRIDTNNLSIGIGKNPESTDSFKGYIDDVRIYNRALSASEVHQLFLYESPPIIGLAKAVKPTFSNLWLGTNYQLQLSSDLANWTNLGSAFAATNTSMVYPQYFDVGDFNRVFFRLQVAP